jgi:PAS domain S-box-containing protein
MVVLDPKSMAGISEMCPAGIMCVDAQGYVRVWNPAATRILGWSAAETLGQPLPSTVRACFETLVAGLPADGYLEAFLTFPRSGGIVTGITSRVSRWGSSPGSSGGWMAFLWEKAAGATEAEVTQLMAREREAMAAAKAERRFRELLEAAPDAILEVDRDGRIVLLNAAAERVFGYRREELLGSAVEQLVPSANANAHQHHRQHYCGHPVTRPMGQGLTLHARRKDGSLLPVEISLSPVAFEDDFHVTAIIRDVTERRAAEEKIRAFNQQLESRNREVERANRLKSEFLASMSHELRTPLHTILGFTELLVEEVEGPLNEKQKRFLTHVYKDSQHLLELINDILDLSKIEAGRLDLKPETFHARDAAEEVMATIRPQAVAKAQKVENRVGDCAIFADRVRFKEILSNLLSNAVKFTPEGGEVGLDSSAGDGFVSFTVSDSGIGIALEEQASIFDKFYQAAATTKGIREGTGLGLAITKRLVELHNGTIRVASAPGEGSRFTFQIPAITGERQWQVLIVEDEPGARELLSTYLLPGGFEIRTVASVSEAIESARRRRPDVVTLDLNLPGYSDWRALDEIRSRPEFTGVPVIVVSVEDPDEAALKRGAAVFLQKPVKKEILLETLKKQLHR